MRYYSLPRDACPYSGIVKEPNGPLSAQNRRPRALDFWFCQTARSILSCKLPHLTFQSFTITIFFSWNLVCCIHNRRLSCPSSILEDSVAPLPLTFCADAFTIHSHRAVYVLRGHALCQSCICNLSTFTSYLLQQPVLSPVPRLN